MDWNHLFSSVDLFIRSNGAGLQVVEMSALRQLLHGRMEKRYLVCCTFDRLGFSRRLFFVLLFNRC